MHLKRRTILQGMGGALAWSLAKGRARSAESGRVKPKIKVGQIGVKHAHASKLSVFRESDEYEVVGIVEPDATARAQAEAQAAFRGLPWMTQEQLLGQSDLQLVLVETPVRELLSAAEACVAAGKHVHLDKPAGESYPQLKRLLSAATERKLLVQMGYMYRYNPAIVLLREFLRRGWLGEVFEIHAVMSKVVDPASRRELAEYPGGIMFELGCHIIDLVIGVAGQPNEVTPYSRRVATAEDSLMDNMLAVFEYSRALATVRSTAVEVDGGDRRQLVVCGTEGTIHIQPLDNPSARLTFSKKRGDYSPGYQDVRFPKYTRYVDDAADIARVIRGEKSPDFSMEHDLAVQSSLLRACGLAVDEDRG